MRILITEATWNTMGLSKGLEDSGFLVTRCDDLASLMEHLSQTWVDAVILDTDLPFITTAEALRKVRAAAPHLPVICAAGKDDAAGRVHLLNLGADDVLVPGMARALSAARVMAVVRRAHGLALPEFRTGTLTLDLASQSASAAGVPLGLTRLEYEVLEALALSRGAMCTKDALLTRLYGWENEPAPRIIDVYVCNIRRKITAAGGDASAVQTYWRRGHRLSTETRPALPAMRPCAPAAQAA